MSRTLGTISLDRVCPLCYTCLRIRIEESEREWLAERFAMYQDILQESWVYQEILQEGLEKGRELALRQTLMSYVETRFPTLVPLAKRQTDMIKDSTILQGVIVKLFSVRTDEEAERYLLTLGSDARKN